MILRRLRTSQYRAFAREAVVELRPLTLLFGYNSAGKSALLRALPLVAESITGASGPLALDGAARGSSFLDVRSRWASGTARMRFGLDWDDGTELDVELVHHASMQREVIETLTLRAPNAPTLTVESDLPDERAEDVAPYRMGEERGRIEFRGWIPQGVMGISRRDELLALGDRLRQTSSSIHWLGALRVPPARLFGLTGVRQRLDVDGAGAGEVLARDSMSPTSEVLKRVDAWYREATRHELQVRAQASGSGQRYYLNLRPLRAPDGVHLSDTGEGMTQVLPVITLGALALLGKLGANPILALEQPELHLHPRAHEHVARFLVEVASKATVVVETHAENLLLAVQLAIASGQIAASNVIVHWVRSTEEGPSYVETIRFDSDARPSQWPPDVFAEDQILKRKILELRHGERAP
jgi:hypothetical protein